MVWFRSAREKRLWTWTLVTLVAIFSTLGLAATLAKAIPSQFFSVTFFVAGCMLVLAAVITHGLQARPSRLEIVVALGVAAAYLMVLVRATSPVERSHIVEYGIVALLVFEALRERNLHGGSVPVPAAVAVFAATAVGTLDECLQLLIPSRVFDPLDIVFNALAATMAVSSSLALSWARRKLADREGS
jgi:hypothetical protein